MSQQINLFNPIFKQQKKHFSARTLAQALAGVLVGAALLGSYTAYRTKMLTAEAQAVSKKLESAEAQLKKVNGEFTPKAKDPALIAEIQRTEAQLKSLESANAVLQRGDFGNTKGYAAYLRAFARQIVDGLWLTGLSIEGAGNEIGVQGRTWQPELIPVYINRLKTESAMQGKSFATLDISTPQPTPNKVDAGQKPAAPGYVEFSLQSVAAPAKAAPGANAK